MTETVTIELGDVRMECEAHVLTTERGCNIELVDYPIVIDYSD